MIGYKTATLTLRIEPALKEALRERRSLANMVEDYSENHGHTIPDAAKELKLGSRSK